MRGCSASTLRRKYEIYLGAKGDWRSLVGQYKGPKSTPVEFQEYVKGLCEDMSERQLEEKREIVDAPALKT